MRKLIIASIAFFTMQACTESYRSKTIDANLIPSLNKEIINGQQNNEHWVKTPEDIARHLFPSAEQAEGRKLYSIEKKEQSPFSCTITVTDEGGMDDELLGERHTLYFHNQEDAWQISNMTVEEKRRF